MSEDIRPHINEDGEPVCNRDCPAYHANNHHCGAGGGWHCLPEFSTLCIPAIKLQRSEAQARAEAAFALVKELKAKVASRKWVTLPTEKSGWFWWRESCDYESIVRHVYGGETETLCTNNCRAWVPVADVGGEWWPVPIQRPGDGE